MGARLILLSLALAVAADRSAAAPAGPFGDAWDWPLPPRTFGSMSQPERVQFTRGEDLLRQGNQAAAAIEFEKFAAQFPNSAARFHALLLQGYAAHLAKERNKAILLYTELLDACAGAPDAAVPALYLKARAQIENGNVDTGIRTLRELTDNAAYLAHPLSDVALNELGAYYAANKDPKAAEQCWMKVVKAYAEAFVRPSGAEKEARRRLVELYLAQGRHDAAEGLMNVQGEDAAAAAPHEKLAYICDAGLAILDQLPPKSRDALLEWLRRRRAVFADAGKEADYFGRALTLALRLDKKSDWAALAKDAAEAVAGARPPALAGQAAWLAARLAEAARAGWPGDEPWKLLEKTLTTAGAALPAAGQLALYGPVLDALGFPLKAGSAAAHTRDVLLARCLELFTAMVNPERDRGIAGLTDRLKTMGEMDRAMEMARRIENAAFSSWKIIELLQFERKFAEMAQACEELEKMDAGEFAARAQRARADAYRDHLARYEEAIKLYNMINDPPGTVWSIVDCYERWGKPEQAVASCSEIEGFFERDAPRAGLRKGEIWKRAGDDKRAIAEFRAVVKKYPRDQVSSTAHQILEQYGIKTGGGVVEE